MGSFVQENAWVNTVTKQPKKTELKRNARFARKFFSQFRRISKRKAEVSIALASAWGLIGEDILGLYPLIGKAVKRMFGSSPLNTKNGA
jgi:hypothetical protein